MICQHCGATVLSTSQPERIGAMPELRDVLMLARDFIDYELPISGKLVVSEIDAALAAQPATPLRGRESSLRDAGEQLT